MMNTITLNTDDLRLAQGCSKGNPKIQEELFRKYHRKMFGVCLRYCENREAAEDVLQEGFIKVFMKIGSYSGQGSLEGWVRRVMVNTALEQVRKYARMVPIVEEEKARFEKNDADVISAISETEILKLVQELPAGYRAVFNMYAIDGYSHKEIAEQLGITEGTSKSQLARARDLLKFNLEKLSASAYGNAQ